MTATERKHRQNPYDLARGEIPISVLDTGAGTFLLSSRRVYRLKTTGDTVNGLWVNTSKFEPIEIERPKTRPPRIRKAKA